MPTEETLTEEYEVVDLDAILGEQILIERDILNSLDVKDEKRQKIIQNYEYLDKQYKEHADRNRELALKERELDLRERQFEHQVKLDEAKAVETAAMREREIDLKLREINAEILGTYFGLGGKILEAVIKCGFCGKAMSEIINLERKDMGTIRTGATRMFQLFKV